MIRDGTLIHTGPVIYIGIDDTDVVGSPGTNQLARAIVKELAGRCRCLRIVRHQLFEHPAVPCTSKNGSASIVMERVGSTDVPEVIAAAKARMLAWFVSGSDPGLCVTAEVPRSVSDFGRRCQTELLRQDDARSLAAEVGICLLGLGGTEDGVIGALAAVGLAATGDDGRVVQNGQWPDDLSGPQPAELLCSRGVAIRLLDTGEPVNRGQIDVGKHLRPNCRSGGPVLFVRRGPGETGGTADYIAVRLP